MTWSLRKKKEGIFCAVILSEDNFLKICILSQCTVYWINFQNIHTFTYQKIFIHTVLPLVSKIVESLQCILRSSENTSLSTQSLKSLAIKPAKRYSFILITFVGMSSFWQALTTLKLLITFSASVLLFFFLNSVPNRNFSSV